MDMVTGTVVALGLAKGQTFEAWKAECLAAGVDIRVLENWHAWKQQGRLKVALVREASGLVLRVGEGK